MSGELSMTIVLGLTGGIASGKSTADSFFIKKHIPVIDSDLIAHHILDIGEKGYNLVINYFGDPYLAANKTIDRAKLGKLVFNSPKDLAKLNEITHPLIFQEIETKISQHKQENEPLIIVDAPLLFESGGLSYCDRSLLIAVPEKMQVKRLMARNHITEAEALKRINSQMPLAQKQKLADYVVTNTGTIKELEDKLNELLLKLIKEDQYGMS